MNRGVLLPALLLAGAAAAQPAPGSGPNRATTVEAVTVRARRAVAGIDVRGDWCPRRPQGQAGGPPRVIASLPRDGQTVPPGPVTISLTFDQRMHCGWAFRYSSGDERCTQIGEWDLPGRRTWRMRCTLPPGEAWTVDFAPVEGQGFASLAGQAAAPFTLRFQTAAEPPPGTSAEPGGPTAVARLVCPEHRLRGAGPRCRVILDDPAEAAEAARP